MSIVGDAPESDQPPPPGADIPTPDRTPPPSAALFAELGWPADANWVRITCDGTPTPTTAPVPITVQLAWPVSPTWSMRYCLPATLPGTYLSRYPGYRFELFGLLHDLVLGPDAWAPPPSTPWPWCWRETGAMLGTTGLRAFAYTVHLWRQRAWYRDSPLCAELRWHPLHGRHHTIVIPTDYAAQGDARQRAIMAADRGLRFLQQLPLQGGGRRDDTGDYRAGEAAVFLADLMPHVQALVDADTDVNYSTVGTQWGRSRKWVSKYCDLFKLNLDHLAAEYRRRRRGQL